MMPSRLLAAVQVRSLSQARRRPSPSVPCGAWNRSVSRVVRPLSATSPPGARLAVSFSDNPASSSSGAPSARRTATEPFVMVRLRMLTRSDDPAAVAGARAPPLAPGSGTCTSTRGASMARVVTSTCRFSRGPNASESSRRAMSSSSSGPAPPGPTRTSRSTTRGDGNSLACTVPMATGRPRAACRRLLTRLRTASPGTSQTPASATTTTTTSGIQTRRRRAQVKLAMIHPPVERSGRRVAPPGGS
jgi:hypothetical protein